jgi:hypothetical protein
MKIVHFSHIKTLLTDNKLNNTEIEFLHCQMKNHNNIIMSTIYHSTIKREKTASL